MEALGDASAARARGRRLGGQDRQLSMARISFHAGEEDFREIDRGCSRCCCPDLSLPTRCFSKVEESWTAGSPNRTRRGALRRQEGRPQPALKGRHADGGFELVERLSDRQVEPRVPVVPVVVDPGARRRVRRSERASPVMRPSPTIQKLGSFRSSAVKSSVLESASRTSRLRNGIGMPGQKEVLSLATSKPRCRRKMFGCLTRE